MKCNIRRLATCFCLSFVPTAQSYETDTHALTTFYAFDRSVLASPSTLDRLGVSRYDTEQPFHLPDEVTYSPERDAYFDFLPTAWPNNLITESHRRKIDAHELKQFPLNYRGSINVSRQRQLKAWLMRGAVREDDLRQEDYEKPEVPPDIDPHGELVRVFHHFYDPVHDRPLTLPLSVPCTVIPGSIPAGCVKSTDWAMGVVDAANASSSAPDVPPL